MTTPATTQHSPVRSVLVANRGEIARRVFATARARGVDCVAVYSDPDARAAHATEADTAVHLPGSTPGETYLDSGAVVDAARAAGADAVHPGYGFLSENADFARAVTDAGLTWIGPSPAAIESMGSKIAAKERMGAAGVPMLTDLDPDTVTADQLPVLVKASAGGGGRGMRVVRSLDALPDEIASAKREAASAFGDDAVFCERYIESGRHIEVQVLADSHGTVWAVGERECSIQRRHQKILEEAPSPLVEATPGMREELFAAAVAAAGAIGYTGAGTVEFLATDSGEFFFLEMNTRLQVEHPVTEATRGLDLVSLQFDVAEGRPLPAAAPPEARGHAIEARLYAEDPEHDYRPTAGTLHTLEIPGVTDEFSGPRSLPGLRLDSSVDPAAGPVEVSTHYDPMLAKVIAAAPTRAEAAAALARALAGARIHGFTTNRDLLVSILGDTEFLAGNTTTAFLSPERLAELSRPVVGGDELVRSAATAALAAEHLEHSRSPLARIPVGFRTVGEATSTRRFQVAGSEIEVALHAADGSLSADGRTLEILSSETDTDARAGVVTDRLRCRLHGERIATAYTVTRRGVLGDPDEPATYDVEGVRGAVAFSEPARHPEPGAEAARGSLLAPMPGAVIRVGASVGDTVTTGQPLLWIEAMKMEHAITADTDGTVTELTVGEGDPVDSGAVLAVITPDEEEDEQ